MEQHKADVVDEVESDGRIDKVSKYDCEMYLTVNNPTDKAAVEANLRNNFNVDVSHRGINIKVEW